MAFFKSKDNQNSSKSELPELPSLPELPELPSLPDSGRNLRPLPSFQKESVEIGAIKNNLNKEFDVKQIGPEKRTIELSDLPASSTSFKQYSPLSPPEVNQKSASKEFFIKLDKFKDAVKKFEEVKTKVREIEESLIKIREIKDKEEQELKSWEQEMQIIKNNINMIDGSLFNKV
jgi:hypothetical protein